MSKNSVCAALLMTFALMLEPIVSKAAESPHVVNVLVFDVGADLSKFTEISKRARAISEKYGSAGKARLWMTQFAGLDSNRVVVVVEYPNLVTMAESMSKVHASPEWRQLVAESMGAGIKLLSNSVASETPQ